MNQVIFGNFGFTGEEVARHMADISSEIIRNVNINVRNLPTSATLAINELSAQLAKSGRQIIRLGLGQSPFPVPKPMVDSLKFHAGEKDYLAVKGLPALRDSISEFLKRTENVTICADNIVIGPGTKELMFALQILYSAELLLPKGSWVSYSPQAHLLARPVKWLPTKSSDGYRITPEIIEQECQEDPLRPRLLILNYPCNPTGVTYSASQLEALAKAVEKYRILVLSDEIYSGLTFARNHHSFARYYPHGTIISNGISKWAGAGGWRLGFFAFPSSLSYLAARLAAIASETFTAVSAPIQYASIASFAHSKELESYLEAECRLLGSLMPLIVKKLRAAGAEVPEPQGAFYVYPDFSPLSQKLHQRGIVTSEKLSAAVLEEIGVAFLPGSCFGHASDLLVARLACVDFDGGAALAAVEALPANSPLDEAFLLKHCSPCLVGIDKICAWLQK